MSQHHGMLGLATLTSGSMPAAHIVCSPPMEPPLAMRSLPFHSGNDFRYCNARMMR